MNLGNVTMKARVGSGVGRRATHKQSLFLQHAAETAKLRGSKREPGDPTRHSIVYTPIELQRGWRVLSMRPPIPGCATPGFSVLHRCPACR